jgi:hypothetical protein
MSLTKQLVDTIAPDDAKKQCRLNAECHRVDGHAGTCQTVAAVLLTKFPAEAMSIAKAWARRMKKRKRAS